MKFVVTGATSFIGSEFVKLILECGHEVYAVCMEHSSALNRVPKDPALTLVYSKLEDYKKLNEKIPAADVFVNFAWYGNSVASRADAEEQQKNVAYIIGSFQAAHKMGCRLFVEPGTQAEYGVVNDLITEETPCHPFSEYGQAKVSIKNACFSLAEELDLKYLHLRIFSVYGEHDHFHTLFLTSLQKMLDDSPIDLSSCTQKWNFLYVRDVAKQIYYLCERSYQDNSFLHEVFNLASEDTRTLRDFVIRMKEVLHSKSVLNFGAFVPEHSVALDPDITKLKNYIGFVSDYTYDEGVLLVAEKIRRRKKQEENVNTDKHDCLLCGTTLDDAFTLFSCDNMPGSAQDIPTRNELQKDYGIELLLVQCRQCGLVQIPTEPVSYYKKVIRAGGGSATMVDLRNKQYQDLISRFNLNGKKILEVGCGQGEFLRIWKNYDVRAVGIEFDLALVTRARREGLEVYKAFADQANTELPEAPYDAFVQFNFLEHQPHPNEMLQCIYHNLKDDGVGLVTVPSLEYILANGYYELIKDHIAYYSEETLKLLFQKNGFEIIDSSTINRDTHSVIVKKRKATDAGFWQKSFCVLKQELHEFIDSYIMQGKKVAAWGASHQGFTLISSLGLGDKISYIIDSAPFKQGKFSPASHVSIVDRKHFFEEPVDSVIIMAPGYTEEIASIIKQELDDNLDIRAIRSDHLERV